jgi:hypothetical protein
MDCLLRLPTLKLALNTSYVKEENTKSYFYAEYKFDEVFNDETIELFKSLNILQYVRGVQLFRCLGKMSRGIHIDGTNPSSNEGVINWVPNDPVDSDWSTDFFNIPYEEGTGTDQKSNLGSAIHFPNHDTLIPITSWTGPTRDPALFRVNVPHRIDNRKDQDRWCYSIRFYSAKLNYYDLKTILQGRNE